MAFPGGGLEVNLEVWVPALPDRALSANGGGRSRRNPWELADAKLALGDVTYHAVLAAYAPNIPALKAPVVVTVTLHAAHGKKPKDHLYRPLDPGNIGGDVLKPLLDYGLVRHGVIPDDDHNTIHEIRLRVRHCETLQEEGIALEVEELEATRGD